MAGQNVYEQLADYLNSMPIGAPKTPELMEILKTLYTQEEAALAVKLPFLPMTLDALADRTGMEEAKLKPMLDKMAKKGTVFVELGSDERMHRLLPTVVGFSETPFWPGKRTPETEKLAGLWIKYARNAFYHEIGGISETPMVRVIPIQQSLSDDRTVAPYEKLVEKVKETTHQAVAHCPCRLMREYSGETRCEHSTENCLHFGSLARYMVAHGMARKITVDETIDILKRSNEEGLVHMTANHQGQIDTICNCCADACIFLTGLLAAGEKHMFARSNYVCEVNQETCVECGTCAERCPVKAIAAGDGPSRIDANKCIGCGVCYPTCSSESISLVSRPEPERTRVSPPGEFVMKVMNDKQREFRF